VCECAGQSALQIDPARSTWIAARLDELRKHRQRKTSDGSVRDRLETVTSVFAQQAVV